MLEKLKVIVAHDYQCPWCYLSFFQARRLVQEFPRLELNWQGYELLPQARTEDQGTRPKASLRFYKLAETDRLSLPPAWPVITNSHLALLGAEFFKKYHPENFDKYNETIYRAFWEKGQDISDP